MSQVIDLDEFVSFTVDTPEGETNLEWFEGLVLSERYFKARASLVFQKLDIDGNGRLTPSELVTLLQGAGESEQGAVEAANRIIDAVDFSSNRAIELN